MTEISQPSIAIYSPSDWKDYELLDSGNGSRLERLGPYTLIRPEYQAVWHPKLSKKEWAKADAVFHPTGDESGGYWKFQRTIDKTWRMRYKALRFFARLGNSRHVGFFPEQAVHWDWISGKVLSANRPVNVLNLFGYTGIASLAAVQAGARVTHVDASKKSISYARENQIESELDTKPIRWIVDDALKFVKREVRRQVSYDGIILDPPKFGRGPKGEVWEFFEALPVLLNECRLLFAKNPLFLVITAYAIRASAVSLYFLIQEIMQDYKGVLESGELALRETSGDRMLSMAIFTRWQST